MPHLVPDRFAPVVAAVRAGHTPSVPVRDLVDWFGFTRRGARVNGYIRSVMQQEGLTCTPSLEAAFADGEITFTSVVPIVVQAAPPAARAELPHPIAVFSAAMRAQSDLARRGV